MKYDTAVLIRDPREFVRSVGRALATKARLEGSVATGQVQYIGRVREEGSRPPDCAIELLKDMDYEHQREWRAIYQPATGAEPSATDAHVVSHADVTRCCEIVEPADYHFWQTLEQQTRFAASTRK